MSSEFDHRGHVFRVRSNHIASLEFEGVFDLRRPHDADDSWSKTSRTAMTFSTHEEACTGAAAAAREWIDYESKLS